MSKPTRRCICGGEPVLHSGDRQTEHPMNGTVWVTCSWVACFDCGMQTPKCWGKNKEAQAVSIWQGKGGRP